jgi:hypothetical protein
MTMKDRCCGDDVWCLMIFNIEKSKLEVWSNIYDDDDDDHDIDNSKMMITIMMNM